MSAKFLLTALALGGSAAASYGNATLPWYTTEVVTAYTTYCPEPTHYVVSPNKTITVTSATTLTITDCPCTLTKPVKTQYTTEVVTAFTTYCPEPTTLTVHPSLTITVSKPTTLTVTDCPCTVTKPVLPPPAYNTTMPVAPPPGTAPPAGTAPGASTTTPGMPEYTGAAAIVEAGFLPLLVAAGAALF